ncbi:hypothetical protein VTK26DRAFT_2836 [Humicola hyalothermophila]
MRHSWNTIFTAGIVWDPREPLPAELLHSYGTGNTGPGHSEDWVDDLAIRPSGNGQQHESIVQLPGQLNTGRAAIPQALVAVTASSVAGPTKRVLPRFTIQEPGRNVLPPLSITVDASIVQDTARVTVTQLFWNDSSKPIKEAAFTFPLPAGCTVTDFSCRVGTHKTIRGTVKPREEAREKFEKHIRTHDTAAGLLEQDTPEIFTTTLGNVPEDTKVKVTLTYITLLKHRFADSKTVTTFTIPTFIARRYGEAPEEYNDAATTDVRRGLTLEVEIVESEKIASITSPSHAIAVEHRQGARKAEDFADLAGQSERSTVETALVKLDHGPLFLDKDFVLDIATTPDGNSGSENPQAWLEEHPTLAGHKALMLTLPSAFLHRNAAPIQRSEILFLADLSGSMSDKIASLKSSMLFFLKGIPEGRKFNIWCFGTGYRSWQPSSVDYDEATLASAIQWVETTFAANMGGTELLPAIKAIVSARDKALMTDVIVLTDGQTWRLDQTLDFIQKTRTSTEGRVRFFALGIGKAVSHALVDGIAKAGGGYAEVVQEASQGGWEDRVVSMAKAALMSAHLGPIHMEFDIQSEDGKTKSSALADSQRSPADVSALSPFERNRVYFLLDSLNKSQTVKGVRIDVTLNHETKSVSVPVVVIEKPDDTIHKLAARSLLDDLERGRSHIHLSPTRPYPGSWEETNTVRKEAEKIACKWSLVSKWTSFFLAEEASPPKEENPVLESVTKVKNPPGQDLLQPRVPVIGHGIVTSSGTEELSSVIRSNARPGYSTHGRYGAVISSTSAKAESMHFVERDRDRTFVPRLVKSPTSNPDSSKHHVGAPFQGSTPGFSPQSRQDPGTPISYEAAISAYDGKTYEFTPPEYYAFPPGPQQAPAHTESSWSIVEDIPEPKASSRAHDWPPDGDRLYGRSRGSVPESEDPRARAMPSNYRHVVWKRRSRPAAPDTDLEPCPSPEGLANPADLEPDFLSAAEGPKQPTERGFINAMLKFQQHNGRIQFPLRDMAIKWLGQDICDALETVRTSVRRGVSRVTLWTAAVLVLLERDFQPHRALWELMALKMAGHCREWRVQALKRTEEGEVEDVVEVVRKRLEGLKLPLHQAKGGEDAESDARVTADAAAGGGETASSDPVRTEQKQLEGKTTDEKGALGGQHEPQVEPNLSPVGGQSQQA